MKRTVALLLLSSLPGFCAQPQHAEAQRHFKRSVALWGKADGDGEIAELRKTLALDPGFQEAHFNLGVAFADKDEFGEAVTEFREAVRLKPSDDLAHHCLALALEKQGDLRDALEESKLACELDGKNGTYKAHYEQVLRIIHALP